MEYILHGLTEGMWVDDKLKQRNRIHCSRECFHKKKLRQSQFSPWKKVGIFN